MVTEDVDVLFFEHGGFWCGAVRCGADVVFVLTVLRGWREPATAGHLDLIYAVQVFRVEACGDQKVAMTIIHNNGVVAMPRKCTLSLQGSGIDSVRGLTFRT